MFNDFWTWANGGFTQGIAVIVVVGSSGAIAQHLKKVSASTKTRWNRRALQFAAGAFSCAQYFAVMGYIWWQLHPLITVDTPPTRLDVFLIVFWTFWLLLLFVRMLTGPFAQKTKQPEALPQSRCSIESANPSSSESSHPGTREAARQMSKLPQGPKN